MDSDGVYRWGLALQEMYDRTWKRFKQEIPRLLKADPRSFAWSDEFQLAAIPYLPARAEGWVALLDAAPWLLNGEYAESDVTEPFPDLKAVLRAVVLNALSDRMLKEIDVLYPAAAAAIDKV